VLGSTGVPNELLRSLIIAGAVRSLSEGAAEDDMFIQVLRDAMSATGGKGWALIGGLAVGFRSEPRGTQDVDLLIVGDLESMVSSLTDSGRFRRIRPHAVEHRESGIEVEILTHDFVKQPEALAAAACTDSELVRVTDFEIPVVRPRYLIALKLKRALGRGVKALQDRADIMRLLAHHGPQDLSDLSLGDDQMELYEQLKLDVQSE
jgi:hypothetical protein